MKFGLQISPYFSGPRGNPWDYVFRAAEFSDSDFPLYIYERLYSRRDIVIEVAKVLSYRSYDEIRLTDEQRERLIMLCKSFGFDIEAPGFDPAIIG